MVINLCDELANLIITQLLFLFNHHFLHLLMCDHARLVLVNFLELATKVLNILVCGHLDERVQYSLLENILF